MCDTSTVTCVVSSAYRCMYRAMLRIRFLSLLMMNEALLAGVTLIQLSAPNLHTFPVRLCSSPRHDATYYCTVRVGLLGHPPMVQCNDPVLDRRSEPRLVLCRPTWENTVPGKSARCVGPMPSVTLKTANKTELLPVHRVDYVSELPHTDRW